ncbi:MAG: T9SS type A sorting domain-containing protein [Chitinophagales bacterium]
MKLFQIPPPIYFKKSDVFWYSLKKQGVKGLFFLSMSMLVISCLSFGVKKENAIQIPSTINKIPPILESNTTWKVTQYLIDTTKCQLSVEDFLKEYEAWIGIDADNTLEFTEKKDIKKYKTYKEFHFEYSYIYKHYYKNIDATYSKIFFYTVNDMVICVGNDLKLMTKEQENQINYTVEDARLMVLEQVKKDNVADIIYFTKEEKQADYSEEEKQAGKILTAGIVDNISKVWISDAKLRINDGENKSEVIYSIYALLSLDGNRLGDKKKHFFINAKTGKIKTKKYYENYGGVNISYSCLETCNNLVDIGGSVANLASDCSLPTVDLYSTCGNDFVNEITLSVPTLGNKAITCPPTPLSELLIDDIVSCRLVEVTQQITCNDSEYNYALYNSNNLLETHIYHYQEPMGLDENLYEGGHIKFPSNSTYIFKENILAGTSAYWGVDISQKYFADKGINSYDGNNSPIEVIIGRPSTSSAEWKQYIEDASGNPIFLKQIFVKLIIEDPDLLYIKLNIIAHEYAHAVIGNYFEVVNGGFVQEFPDAITDLAKAETDALHEALADIFAILIMDKARQDGILCNSAEEQAKKWLMDVDQIEKRHLNNPANSQTIMGIPQAIYYNNEEYNTVLDNYADNPSLPYYKAGIIAYWFYLATEGSSSSIGGIEDICGLGIETMTDVLFGTLEKCKAVNGNNSGYTPSFEEFCIKSLEAITDFTLPEEEKCQIRKCVLKAWKAVGLGLTIAGKNEAEADESLCFVDLRMRDNNWDSGQEPNYSAGVDADGDGWSIDSAADWEDIWDSPDLWTCPDNDNCNSEAGSGPVSGYPNKVGFSIYNAHPNLVSDPAELHIYYTMASTAEDWETQWINNTVWNGTTPCYLGNEISNSNITIPAIDPETYYTNWVSWTPPNFFDASIPIYTNPSLCPDLTLDIDPADGELKYEICLLARLISEADPIVGEALNVPIRDNVLNSNNIVTKNMFLIDPAFGMPAGLGNPIPGRPSVILVANNNDHVKNLDIVFDKISAGSTTTLNNVLEVSFVLSPELWAKWESTGKESEGIEIIDEREVKVTNLEIAKLLNLPFDAREFQPFAIKVTIITNTGKTVQSTFSSLPEDFGFRITHRSSDGSPINKPSNCLFKLENISETYDLAQDLLQQMQIFPNPFQNTSNISFYLSETENVSIDLYDLQGRLVKTVLANENLRAGKHRIVLEADNLKNGVYLCVLNGTKTHFSQKIVKMK